jgi:hypothetical protein
VSVKVEAADLDPITRLSIVEVVDQLRRVAEEDEVDAVFVSNADDMANQVCVILALSAADIARLIDQPGNARSRTMLLT